MGKKIMIVTGEASGDLHGANLVRAIKEQESGHHFFGMGGTELRDAGVDICFDSDRVSVVGIVEVFAHLGDIYQGQKLLRKKLLVERPDLLILVDLPDFNLLLAKKAKKIGIPVFYYICPQVWAWRSGRVKALAERVDTLGVILPFEEPFFNARGLNATYVGHPLLDSVRTDKKRDEFLNEHKIEAGRKIIGLLPGSRKREVTSLLPIFLQAAELVARGLNEKVTFLIPKAPSVAAEIFEDAGIDLCNADVRLIEGERYNLMSSCDCVVAASGTVTLELALLHIPMVVTYRLSPFTYRIAKALVKLNHFSLVNLIAERAVVPELLQEEVNGENISRELLLLLNAFENKKVMVDGLNLVNSRLGAKGASSKAATAALKMLQGREVD